MLLACPGEISWHSNESQLVTITKVCVNLRSVVENHEVVVGHEVTVGDSISVKSEVNASLRGIIIHLLWRKWDSTINSV